MKKLFALFIVCSLFAFTGTKEYKLTDSQAAMVYNIFQTAKRTIPASEVISAKEATTALMQIDSIEKVIYRQYTDSAKK